MRHTALIKLVARSTSCNKVSDIRVSETDNVRHFTFCDYLRGTSLLAEIAEITCAALSVLGTANKVTRVNKACNVGYCKCFPN